MWTYDVDDVAERLRSVGKGSNFRYETAVLPWTDEQLQAMLSESEASRMALFDKMVSPKLFDMVSDPAEYVSMRRKLDSIIRSEGEIFTSVRRILESTRRPDNSDVVVASALITIRRINAYLGANLSTDDSEVEESDLNVCCDQLEIQSSSIAGLAHA